jgi:hypothetical protein
LHKPGKHRERREAHEKPQPQWAVPITPRIDQQFSFCLTGNFSGFRKG